LPSFSTTSAIAAPTVSQVYSAAPDGLDISNYMTGVDKYSDGTLNSAKIYKAGSSYGNKSDIVQLMSGESGANSKQLSSIWGTRPGDISSADSKIDNYFDLSKNKLFPLGFILVIRMGTQVMLEETQVKVFLMV
jgi:hypothetical protein